MSRQWFLPSTQIFLASSMQKLAKGGMEEMVEKIVTHLGSHRLLDRHHGRLGMTFCAAEIRW